MSIENEIAELTKTIAELTKTIRGSDILFKQSELGLPEKSPETTEKVLEEAPKEKSKKKKKRRTKAEIEDSIYDLPESEPAKPDEDEPIFNMSETEPGADKPEEAVPDKIPTLEQLRSEAAILVDMDNTEKQLGLKAALRLMEKCGARTLKEVREADRAGLIKAFKEEVEAWPKKR